jgi:hypothetical protein
MAEIPYKDRMIIERLFDMKSGYVMDFSNSDFQDFIFESVGINVFEEKYNFRTGSKANRLRHLFKIESNQTVHKLLKDLIEYWHSQALTGEPGFKIKEFRLYNKCTFILKDLEQNKIDTSKLDLLTKGDFDEEFEILKSDIKSNIKKDLPQVTLDRLHTFTFKLIRYYLKKNGLDFKKEESLNALFGKYVKNLRLHNKIETDMSERILKSSISILDSFNSIRNDKSLAHDNTILNYHESVLIFNNIISLIEFINSLESNTESKSTPW